MNWGIFFFSTYLHSLHSLFLTPLSGYFRCMTTTGASETTLSVRRVWTSANCLKTLLKTCSSRLLIQVSLTLIVSPLNQVNLIKVFSLLAQVSLIKIISLLTQVSLIIVISLLTQVNLIKVFSLLTQVSLIKVISILTQVNLI